MIKLAEREICTGCSACYVSCTQNAITMIQNDEGFFYPEIDNSLCISCRKCENICPILQTKIANNNIKLSYIAKNSNEKERMESASGGIFSNIAKYIIKNDGVVFGAAYDENLIVRHIAVECEEELYKLRMSKYVQSSVGNTFKQVLEYLESGRLVLYSGTPCQISGLSAFLGRKYDNLILLDVVCHGVPSPKIFEKYKEELENRYNSRIKNIFFRCKVIGHAFSTIAIQFENTKLKHSSRLIKSYPRLWFAGYISRPSCHNCNYKELDRVSDFTLFDSFKSADIYKFKDDDKGLSNVYIRTDKAKEIWNLITKDVNAVQTEFEITSALDGDMIYESAKMNEKRDEFWQDQSELSYSDLINKYIPYSTKERIMDFFKRFLVRIGLMRSLRIKKLLSKFK